MQSFIQSLKVVKQIGAGGFGKIFLAKSEETGASYAIKTISKSTNQKHNIEREVNAGQICVHKNIGSFICHFEDENNDYLVYDLIQGSDMFSTLEKRGFKPYTEAEAKTIFRQLLNALDFCHKNGVIHMDIKLDNIMINPDTLQVTLIDFGLCDFVTAENGGKFSRQIGSPEYCAPELIQKSVNSYDGAKVDIFSLGVTLFAMISATFPFDVKKRKEAIRQGSIPAATKFPFAISKEGKDLICGMMESNPEKRVGLAQIFEHPWVCQL